MNNLGFAKKKSDTKVTVAMSGGIDSSVAAVMLKKQGYDVTGITLRLYTHQKSPKSKTCCSGQDIEDAKKVADQFNFPHFTYDYQDRFFTGVIDKFVESYSNGETPVPCINCNQTVKFNDLLNEARKNNSDVLVTGHYARRVIQNNNVYLLKAKDKTKDQSYFLFATTREQLNYIRFPLGEYLKSEIRNIANNLNLPIKDKPDSQDICFVTSDSYRELINKLKPESNIEGSFLNLNNNIIGKHMGIANYTVGQRKGLGISGTEKALYVIKIDAKNNNIYLGEKKDLKKSIVYLKDLNWISNVDHNSTINCYARIRSSQKEIKGVLKKENSKIFFEFDKKINSTSPGQACVFYRNEEVLGGGWITEIQD